MSTIPAGYKQTEVGVIPEEWVIATLPQVTEVIDGDRGHNYPSASDFNSYGYCLFLNASNVTSKGFQFAECMFISMDKDKKLSKGKLNRNDIVLTTRGSVGNYAYFDEKVPFSELRINSGMVIIRCTSKLLNSQFLYKICQSNILGRQIERLSFGSAQPQLTVKGIATLQFPLPSLAEQKRIAQVLGDVDALIQKLEALIAKKRDIKQASMQELLTGKRRLPGFSGAWETKRLGEIASMGSGGTPKSSVADYYDGNIPWVSISDISSTGKYIEATERSLSQKGYENCAAQMFACGTVLFAMYASIGECCIARKELCTSQAILGIRVSERLSNEYLYYFLFSLKSKVKKIGQQGTQANLNKGMVEDIAINLPPLPEQAAIAQVLSDIDAELEKLETRLAKTRDLKAGLMAELLTGRIRLRVAN